MSGPKPAVVEVDLVPHVEDAPQGESLAHQRPAVSSDLVVMLEGLVKNPDVPVDKLERIIALQEHILDRQAQAAFDHAFAQLQAHIPTVRERGKTDKGTYATRENIIDAVRPVLSRYGFSLAFRTEWPDATHVKVVGILTHEGGHQRQSEFLSAADTSGSKNAVQALGSAVEYGRRYTTTDLLCIVTTGADDDGQRSSAPDAPPDYEQWVDDLTSAADEGYVKFEQAWKATPQKIRNFMANHDKATGIALKARAKTAGV